MEEEEEDVAVESYSARHFVIEMCNKYHCHSLHESFNSSSYFLSMSHNLRIPAITSINFVMGIQHKFLLSSLCPAGDTDRTSSSTSNGPATDDHLLSILVNNNY